MCIEVASIVRRMEKRMGRKYIENLLSKKKEGVGFEPT
jgi:hypothetical protein